MDQEGKFAQLDRKATDKGRDVDAEARAVARKFLLERLRKEKVVQVGRWMRDELYRREPR